MKAYIDKKGYIYIHCQGSVYEIYKDGECISMSFIDNLFISLLEEIENPFEQK